MSLSRFFSSAARAFVAACALGGLLASLAYWAGLERSWVLAQLQYLPWLAFLVPAGLALVLAWPMGLRWRAASLASLFLVATVPMGFELNRGEAGAGRVRFMTYNVKGYLAVARPEGVVPIAYEIALHDADVIVLQDATELANLSSESRRAFFGERQVQASGQYLIASRFPLKACGTGSIAFRGLPHSFFHCIAIIEGREVNVVTAHLMTPRMGLNAIRHEGLAGIAGWKQNVADRLAQSEGLAHDLETRRRPMIVAGDFNATQSSLVVRRLLATGLRDAFAVAGVGFGYSYGHSLWPGISFLRIDHILVSEGIAVADCFTGGREGSPHRPVIADLFVERG